MENNPNNPQANRGQNLSQEARSKGGQNSPSNFKNDPQRAADLGRKGGEATQGGRGRDER